MSKKQEILKALSKTMKIIEKDRLDEVKWLRPHEVTPDCRGCQTPMMYLTSLPRRDDQGKPILESSRPAAHEFGCAKCSMYAYVDALDGATVQYIEDIAELTSADWKAINDRVANRKR